MKIKYVGPHASVVLTVDKTDVEVQRGEEFDAPDDEAKRLLEQDEDWAKAGAKAPAKKTAKKAAQIVNTDEASAPAEPNKED